MLAATELGALAPMGLSVLARIRIEDAARTFSRALGRAPLGSACLLSAALGTVMRKARAPFECTLSTFHERLVFLAVVREATRWARELHPDHVANELARFGQAAVHPDDPATRAVDALEADLTPAIRGAPQGRVA